MQNERFRAMARGVAVSGLLLAAAAPAAGAEDLPSGPPDAVLDLRTAEGAAAAHAVWRYRDAHLREVPFRAAGPDHKPSGPPNTTLTLEPLAGAADFDDSAWTVLAPTQLEDRAGTGRVSFVWYRLHVELPAKIGAFETAGATVVFETVVDDYAEVWVNGSLPFDLHSDGLGQSGGAVIAGWNMPNRRLVAADARPGEPATVAIFAANGPLSDPPPNYIWIRRARLAFYRAPRALTPLRVDAKIDRLDPALDRALAPDAHVEKVAEGFAFTEGPVWVPDAQGGSLLFSDPDRNRIYRYDPAGGGHISVFRGESGYQGPDVADYGQPGSNGLALDPRDGALTIDEHGNRRVAKLAADGTETALADSYRGARLNSPNDLVYRSDGTLYFTDPPFGLPKFFADPRKELPYSGVFKLDAHGLELVSQDLTGPNGIAFSPDEKLLYVTNWDAAKKVVMRYDVAPDGALANGRVFFDMAGAPGEEALDGLKVDSLGNLYVSGPGGVWILSPQGAHIGQIAGPELPANFAWGDADRKTLYMTARTGLYRIRLEVPGAGAARAIAER
jgi:gluconolactonase